MAILLGDSTCQEGMHKGQSTEQTTQAFAASQIRALRRLGILGTLYHTHSLLNCLEVFC
jgi:hypothetical protein